MKQPPSTKEKLRIIFRNSLRKGYIKNVELDPAVRPALQLTAEPEETFIVKVDSSRGGHYWFSDRRLLQEAAGATRELLRYEAIQEVHWMFSDLMDRLKVARSPDEISKMKRDYFDRLEIELPTGNVSLEGLDEAYSPTLTFFRWVIRSKGSPM